MQLVELDIGAGEDEVEAGGFYQAFHGQRVDFCVGEIAFLLKRDALKHRLLDLCAAEVEVGNR